MPVSRANVETILIARVGAWLTAAELDGVTVSGANLSLNDPLGWAIRHSSGTVTAAALVTDADVATVADADLDQLIDLAEYRALLSALSNFTGVDKKAGPVELKSSQLGDRLLARIAQLRSEISLNYGVGGFGAFSVSLTRTDGYSDLQAALDAA
jgi:hypothetical protein